MNFNNVTALTINGNSVKQLTIDGNVVWTKNLVIYDYLESDGTAYIDTNYVITSYYQIDTKYKYNSRSSFNTLYGVMPSSSTVSPRMGFHHYSGKWMYGINNTTSIITSDTSEHTLQDTFNNNQETIVLDTATYSSSVSSSALSTNSLSLYLFARHQAEGGTNNSAARIYYFKLYDSNGTLVRDFKPCTYNGEAGLWDIVNNVFYGNANSSGSFTVG